MADESFEIKHEKSLDSLVCNAPRNWSVSEHEETGLHSTVIGMGYFTGLSWKWVASNDTKSSTTTSKKVFSTYLQLTWDQKEMPMADGFEGCVSFTLCGNKSEPMKKEVPFKVHYSGEWFGVRCLKVLNRDVNYYGYTLKFELNCTPFYPKASDTDVMKQFASSNSTDAVLSVEGTTLYVNRSFLSFHSKYFEKMFSSSFKEKHLPVIELKEVSLDDFTRVLSLIYPEPITPTVEKLKRHLQLADMYLMPGATRQLEKFIEDSKRVKIIEKICLADEFHLKRLLKTTLLSIIEEQKLKALTRLPEFSTLSDNTKAAFMERFMHFF